MPSSRNLSAHHMETASGEYVDVLGPEPSGIRLEDIAHHLAHINRYTGAASRSISVAEHTLLVAGRLRAQGHDDATVLHGLHHDDAEAYIGDIGRPLKLALAPLLRPIEDAVTAAIAAALGLPAAYDHAAVKAADDWALAAEAWYLLPSHGREWVTDGLYDPDDRHNPPAACLLAFNLRVDPDVYARIWLDKHHRLTGRTVREHATELYDSLAVEALAPEIAALERGAGA